MTTTNNIQDIAPTLVGAYLRATRLPLTLVERVTGQRNNAEWPPAMLYEGFEANVETVLGSLLRNAPLVDRGRLRQAKLEQLRKAAELETVAAQQRVKADETFEQRRARADKQREQAEHSAEQREQQIERQAEERKQQVRDTTAKKAAAVRADKAAADKATDRQERLAKTRVLSEEAEALGATKEALEADSTVEVIEDTLEGTKAARQSG